MNDDNDATTPRPPARARSLTQRLVEAIEARIRDGTVRPGERLPTEPEMEREFGVSRTVVREALSQLKAGGRVETRHGIGTFVRAAAPALRDGGGPPEFAALLEVRLALEPEAAALAAARRGDADLRALDAELDAVEAACRAGGDATEEVLRFHLAVAAASGNRHFGNLLRSLGGAAFLHDAAGPSTAAGLDDEAGPGRLVHDCKAVRDAIRAQDADAARAAMRRRLTNVRRRLAASAADADG